MLESFFETIEWPNKSRLIKLYDDNEKKMLKAKWSPFKHQAWEWGYLDHIEELWKIAEKLFHTMNGRRSLDFTLSEANEVFALHDLEKPWKYWWTDEEVAMIYAVDYQEFIQSKIDEYGIKLNDKQKNALKYIHWEWDDYSKEVRVMWPLAAFVHCVDTISARIWHDYPERNE